MVHQQKGGDGPAFSVVCIERFGRVRCIQEVGTREKSVSVDQKAVVVILIQMAEGVVMRVIVAPASLVLVIFGYQFVDRKSTRLNSSHVAISYAVFCLKKKN